ncbi:agouti-signaling protein 2b [Synchiropus splendidus]|uniref:agouti-signaling protein 2b n=1 Tax=Synchiropus splendidus TaxID=270530 RepID=UPI00237D5491|nr:agouti-signaling protein 2b [Synchiropus splendidus]
MRITGSHVCLVLLAVTLSAAHQSKKSGKRSDNGTAWSQAKNRRLFARQKIQKMSAPLENRIPRHKVESMTVARRCSHLKETCSTLVSCCDPCAACRCRLFNTICHCWRMNTRCFKRM